MSNSWDKNAAAMYEKRQIGADPCFEYVLRPTFNKVFARLKHTPIKSILEVGCGTGQLVQELVEHGESLVGIDISSNSIEIARQHSRHHKIKLHCTSVEKLASETKEAYDVIYSNMVLNNVEDLNPHLVAQNHLLKPNGTAIHALPHPCFYPQIKTSFPKEVFEYQNVSAIDFPLKLHGNEKELPAPITYYHRPLSCYIDNFVKIGWTLQSLLEPMPDKDDKQHFERPWTLPGFIVFVCKKG